MNLSTFLKSGTSKKSNMAELIVFESSLQIVKKFLTCMNLLTQKLLTRASNLNKVIGFMTIIKTSG